MAADQKRIVQCGAAERAEIAYEVGADDAPHDVCAKVAAMSQLDGAYGLRLLSKARQQRKPTAISDVIESARLSMGDLSFGRVCDGRRLRPA